MKRELNLQPRSVQLEITKDGSFALWEKGGMSKTAYGEAWIVAGKDFSPKHPIYVRQWGHLERSYHALIPVEEGDYYILGDTAPQWNIVVVYRLENFKIYEDGEVWATGVPVAWYDGDDDKWNSIKGFDSTLADFAADAALTKARCLNCKYPHYVKEPVVR